MDVSTQLRQLADDGFCIIEDVVPSDRVDAVRSSVLATVEKVLGDRGMVVRGVSFVPGLINHDQSYAPYLADERMLAIAEGMLGHHVRISYTSAIINMPGNPRGHWHADWPFNQKNAGHIAAPYPDLCMHLTTLWMLSPFNETNGGTLVVPGSHRTPRNPTADIGVDPAAHYPTEFRVTGKPGSVLIFDSRMWHCPPPNSDDQPRVALAVRYAPWWLNLDILMPGSEERKRMVDETGINDNRVPSVPRDVFDALPDNVKPLYRHWLEPRVAHDERSQSKG